MKAKKTSKSAMEGATNKLLDDAKVRDAVAFINKQLSHVVKHDLGSKYAIGQKVQEIRATTHNEKYRKSIVRTIAKEVRLSAACLYQYADVARTWDEGAFADKSKRAAASGLMFSHFVELAHDDHGSARDARVEEAIEKRLTVRQIRAKRVAPKVDELKDDALVRFRSEGPSSELRESLEEAIKAARLQQCEIEERIHELEAAKRACSDALASTGEAAQ